MRGDAGPLQRVSGRPGEAGRLAGSAVGKAKPLAARGAGKDGSRPREFGVLKPTYYNEIDPFAVAWLRNLIEAGQLPAGDVDDRSIVDVRPGDLRGYGSCHFFAGIGGWPYALRLAGVAEETWTGSCPCQPFSVAGSGKGTADERHLWPAFRRLIEECQPPIVFGEQVAGKAGRTWLTGVRADLEARGYAVGAANLCAAGVGAPHIRQRLYWVAHSEGDRARCEIAKPAMTKPSGQTTRFFAASAKDRDA